MARRTTTRGWICWIALASAAFLCEAPGASAQSADDGQKHALEQLRKLAEQGDETAFLQAAVEGVNDQLANRLRGLLDGGPLDFLVSL